MVMSNNSNLMMSDQTGTRVNMTNPFTGSRYKGYADHQHYAQPFEHAYPDNSYTYTLQHPMHQHPVDESSYDDEAESSETSSDQEGEEAGSDSSLTDYEPHA